MVTGLYVWEVYRMMYRAYAARLIEEHGRCPACFGEQLPTFAAEMRERPPSILRAGPAPELNIQCPNCKEIWYRRVREPAASRALNNAEPMFRREVLRKLLAESATRSDQVAPQRVEPSVGPLTPASRSRLLSTRRAVGQDRPVISLAGARVLDIKPGGRYEEDLDEETKSFDFSASSSESTQRISYSHTTRTVLNIDTQNTKDALGHAGVNFLDFVSVEGQIQTAVMARHSLSLESNLMHEQSSEIRIPAHTHLTVTVRWKRIWEKGVIVLGTAAGPLAEVPYSVTIKLGFDISGTDEVHRKARGSPERR